MGSVSQQERGGYSALRHGHEGSDHRLPRTALRGRRTITRMLAAARSAVVASLRTTPPPAGPRWAGPPEARAVEGQLEGLARATPNEGDHLEGALDLRLQVCRPADRRLRVNEGRLLRAVQKQRRLVGGRGLRLIQWWCLVVECCGRGGRLHDRVSYTILPWASIFSTDVV